MADISWNLPEITGRAEISERHDHPTDPSRYSSDVLVKQKKNLSIGLSTTDECDEWDDEVLLVLRIDCHHLENDETQRAFHVNLDVPCDVKTLQQMRDFIDYVLNTPTDEC